MGVLPLVQKLKDPLAYTHSWYADDSSCGGKLRKIRDWFDRLVKFGPSYGYWAEPSKSIVIVKEEHVQSAKNVFPDLSIKIVLADRFLGGYIGNGEDTRRLLRSKIT